MCSQVVVWQFMSAGCVIKRCEQRGSQIHVKKNREICSTADIVFEGGIVLLPVFRK